MGARWLFRIVLALVAIGSGIYRLLTYGFSEGNVMQNGVLLLVVGTIILATALWHYRQIKRY